MRRNAEAIVVVLLFAFCIAWAIFGAVAIALGWGRSSDQPSSPREVVEAYIAALDAEDFELAKSYLVKGCHYFVDDKELREAVAGLHSVGVNITEALAVERVLVSDDGTRATVWVDTPGKDSLEAWRLVREDAWLLTC